MEAEVEGYLMYNEDTLLLIKINAIFGMIGICELEIQFLTARRRVCQLW